MSVQIFLKIFNFVEKMTKIHQVMLSVVLRLLCRKQNSIKLNDIPEQLDSMSTGAEQLGAGPAAVTGAVADIDAHTELV